MYVLVEDMDTGAPAGIVMDIDMATGMVITGAIQPEPGLVTERAADLLGHAQLPIMYTVTVPMGCNPPEFGTMRHSQMPQETKLEILTGRGHRGTHKTGPRQGLQISPIMYTATVMVMSSAGTTTETGNKGRAETGKTSPVAISK